MVLVGVAEVSGESASLKTVDSEIVSAHLLFHRKETSRPQPVFISFAFRHVFKQVKNLTRARLWSMPGCGVHHRKGDPTKSKSL